MAKKQDNKLYGIIGYPLKHSLSPYMHNAAFKRLKINASYITFPAERDGLKQALLSLRERGISGFNITIPFKSESIKYIDKVEATAKMIGAVNTVVVRNKRFIGYNTDYLGFIRSLKEDLRFKPKGRSVFVLGAGGAARAVCFGLAKEEAKAIYIYDIVPSKARLLSSNIKRFFPKCDARYSAKKDIAANIKDCQLLVNCTPSGMEDKGPLPIDTRLLHEGLSIYDIIYTPLKTRLVEIAGKKGMRATGGLGMLLYQGAIAFRIWTKRKPPISLMRKVLLDNMLKKSSK